MQKLIVKISLTFKKSETNFICIKIIKNAENRLPEYKKLKILWKVFHTIFLFILKYVKNVCVIDINLVAIVQRSMMKTVENKLI